MSKTLVTKRAAKKTAEKGTGCGDGIHMWPGGSDATTCLCGAGLNRPPSMSPIYRQPSRLSDDDRRAAFMALVKKWEDDALGMDAMGYSQQADRIRACADELEALLAQRPEGQEQP